MNKHKCCEACKKHECNEKHNDCAVHKDKCNLADCCAKCCKVKKPDHCCCQKHEHNHVDCEKKCH